MLAAPNGGISSFFLPGLTVAKGVRLLDWEGLSLDTRPTTRAYMIAMLWYPSQARIDRRCLDGYLRGAIGQQRGAADRKALDDDYPLSVLLLILRRWGKGAGTSLRASGGHLERIMLAVDDLGCPPICGLRFFPSLLANGRAFRATLGSQ